MAKFTTQTPLSLLCSNKLSFLNVSLKISSLLNFAIKSPKIIYILYSWNSMNSYSNSSYKLCFEVSTLSIVGAHKFCISHQQPLAAHDILSLPNSAHCYCWQFTSYIKKHHTHLHIQCPSCPTWPLVFPLNLIHTLLIYLLLSSMHPTHSSHSKFQTSWPF
jgi:hypothetical protein